MSSRATLALRRRRRLASTAGAQERPFQTVQKPRRASRRQRSRRRRTDASSNSCRRRRRSSSARRKKADTSRVGHVRARHAQRLHGAAPDFKAVRITKFLNDDGVDVGSVRLSDDGTMAIFVRGSGQNRVGWVANPSHDPNGRDRAVWAAKTDGTGAWRLGVDR